MEGSEAPGVLLLEEFRLKEAGALVPPIDAFGKGRWLLPNMNALMHNPYVEQHFADASGVSGVEGVVLVRVEPAGKFEQYREKPGTVRVEMLSVHDHHIENMCATLPHEAMPSRHILRGDVLKDLFGDVELACVHRMGIM